MFWEIGQTLCHLWKYALGYSKLIITDSTPWTVNNWSAKNEYVEYTYRGSAAVKSRYSIIVVDDDFDTIQSPMHMKILHLSSKKCNLPVIVVCGAIKTDQLT